jgi:hypothetical protein
VLGVGWRRIVAGAPNVASANSLRVDSSNPGPPGSIIDPLGQPPVRCNGALLRKRPERKMRAGKIRTTGTTHTNRGRRLGLAHRWRLAPMNVSDEAIRDFIRPAIRAVPGTLARSLMPCEVSLPARLAGGRVASRWVVTENALEIALASEGIEPHDLTLELLVCLGQALWDVVSREQYSAWLALLRAEIQEQTTGEIDEQALAEKRALLSSRAAAQSSHRLERYARASFAGTAAEYVHCLWHDVTIRSGVEYLPPHCLRRRLELMAQWFPPDRGYRLFPSAASTGS